MVRAPYTGCGSRQWTDDRGGHLGKTLAEGLNLQRKQGSPVAREIVEHSQRNTNRKASWKKRGTPKALAWWPKSVTLALGYLKEANLAFRMQSCSRAPCSAVLFVFGFLFVCF